MFFLEKNCNGIIEYIEELLSLFDVMEYMMILFLRESRIVRIVL